MVIEGGISTERFLSVACAATPELQENLWTHALARLRRGASTPRTPRGAVQESRLSSALRSRADTSRQSSRASHRIDLAAPYAPPPPPTRAGSSSLGGGPPRVVHFPADSATARPRVRPATSDGRGASRHFSSSSAPPLSALPSAPLPPRHAPPRTHSATQTDPDRRILDLNSKLSLLSECVQAWGCAANEASFSDAITAKISSELSLAETTLWLTKPQPENKLRLEAWSCRTLLGTLRTHEPGPGLLGVAVSNRRIHYCAKPLLDPLFEPSVDGPFLPPAQQLLPDRDHAPLQIEEARGDDHEGQGQPPSPFTVVTVPVVGSRGQLEGALSAIRARDLPRRGLREDAEMAAGERELLGWLAVLLGGLLEKGRDSFPRRASS